MKTNRHVIYPRTFRIRMCDTITNNIPSRAHILKGTFESTFVLN